MEAVLTNPQNVIHQLLYELGVNLDYVPQTWKEAFVMGLQLVAALCFLYWFLKYLFTFVRGCFSGRSF